MEIKKESVESYENEVLDLSKPKSNVAQDSPKPKLKPSSPKQASPRPGDIIHPYYFNIDHLSMLGYTVQPNIIGSPKLFNTVKIIPSGANASKPEAGQQPVLHSALVVPPVTEVTVKDDLIEKKANTFSSGNTDGPCSPSSSNGSNSSSTKPDSDNKEFVCPQKGCGEVFKCSRMLRHHVEGCDVDRNYKCPCCKQTSKTLTLFLEHIQTHDFLDSSAQARRRVSRKPSTSSCASVKRCRKPVKITEKHLSLSVRNNEASH